MSWNLLIHSDGSPLGTATEITDKFSGTFPELHWHSPAEAELPAHGFRMDLTLENGFVQDIYTHGGFSLVQELAGLCRNEGWQLADAQEGENVDLENPVAWFEERMG